MPENPGSGHCPVLSFEKYISKLHPSCDKLWQRPRDDFDESDATWYCNVQLGEKPLATFMSNISKKCRLSQVYTNHSIRATGATILAKHMYANSQIMAVSYRTQVCLYQHVDKEDKIRMGQTLTDNMF